MCVGDSLLFILVSHRERDPKAHIVPILLDIAYSAIPFHKHNIYILCAPSSCRITKPQDRVQSPLLSPSGAKKDVCKVKRKRDCGGQGACVQLHSLLILSRGRIFASQRDRIFIFRIPLLLAHDVGDTIHKKAK